MRARKSRERQILTESTRREAAKIMNKAHLLASSFVLLGWTSTNHGYLHVLQLVLHFRKMGRHRRGHFLLNHVQTVLQKTVAKSTACLSYVNDPGASAARNSIDQLAGDTRKKPRDFDLPLCSGNAVRGVNERTGPEVTSVTRRSAYLTLENLR